MTGVASQAEWTEMDDFLGDPATNDSANFYQRMREQDPVYFNPRWGGWVLTAYDDVARGFRDYERLSSNRMAGPWGKESMRTGGDGSVSQLFFYIGNFFAWMDPPDHTRFRKMLQETFTPKSVEEIRPRVIQLAGDLIDALPHDQPFDFVDRFSFHLPVIVISEYLGTPAEAREEVRQWSDDLSHAIFVRAEDGVPTKDRNAMGERAIGNFAEFFRAVIRERRASPRDDLISRMTQVSDGGDALTDDEIISQCILMLFAGHETTANLLANGIFAFDRNPDQWQLLRDQPELAKTATEEMLRFDGPIAAQGRWARTSFEIRDKQIQENDRVLLVQYAANHDPEVFEHPERFDITRTPNRHLGFGHGIHTCLGSPLARIETQESLKLLASRYSAVEVVTEPVRYKATLNSRSLEELQVRLHA
jgi:cytochrome P450